MSHNRKPAEHFQRRDYQKKHHERAPIIEHVHEIPKRERNTEIRSDPLVSDSVRLIERRLLMEKKTAAPKKLKVVGGESRRARFKRQARKEKEARSAPKDLKETVSLTANVLLSSAGLVKPKDRRMKLSHLMPKPNKIVCCFAFMLVIQQTLAQSSQKQIEDEIEQICTTKFKYTMANKPRNMRMDIALNKTWTPARCAKSERAYFSVGPAPFPASPYEPSCYSAVSAYVAWPTSSQAAMTTDILVNQVRSVASRDFSQAVLDLNGEVQKITPHLQLSPSQATQFNTHVQSIQRLIQYNIVMKHADARATGNCGEHGMKDAIEILRLSLKFNTIIRFQSITVSRAGIDNHFFLIVNGDGKDVNIRNDEAKTRAYIKKLKKGAICDSWNYGYFAPVAMNTNALYRYGWESIEVQNISLDFNFSNLPKMAVDFLNQQLKKLGFESLFGKPEFNLFSQPTATAASPSPPATATSKPASKGP